MKRKNLLFASALLLAGGFALGSCGHKNDKDADTANPAGTYEMDEVTTDGQDTLTTQMDAVVEPDGDVVIDNTLPTENVTPASTDKDGYTTTASGLKYKVIKKGNGAHPGPTSTVKVKYTGKLQNGTVFDSTDKHGGAPISFPLNQVIPGWTEGLQLMQPGAVYEFVIPGNLAYGPKGIPGTIPPNATLIFDVELLEIQ